MPRYYGDRSICGVEPRLIPISHCMLRRTEAVTMMTPDALPWHGLVDGIDFQLFYASAETGRFTVMLRCAAGSFFARHKHLGAGEYYVVKGRMEYRMGSAPAGTYGYEPLDAIHDHTAFPEYTELLFTNYGPVVFLDAEDRVSMILDHKLLTDIAAG